jgi:hypothetical protein
MRGRIRMIASVALLVLAMTAGAASAGALITGAQVKDGSVGRADVRDGSLAGVDVRDGSLGLADFAAIPPGPKGPDGLPGYPGTNGAPDLRYRTAPRILAADDQVFWTARCESGEQSIGGGVSTERPDLVKIVQSFADGAFWSVEVDNESTVAVRAHAWALCVSAPG